MDFHTCYKQKTNLKIYNWDLLCIQYIIKLCFCQREFPDPFNPVGDPTTKHIRPPPTPTTGLYLSRFSEPCFALSMLRRGNALDRQIVTNGKIVDTLASSQCLPCLESTIIPPPVFHHQPFVESYPNGMSVMGVTKQIQLKQIQKDQPDAELEEDFEESQYGSSADSDGRKPKYQLIKEKDDEIMGRGQGGEKYDWGIDWEGYDVCEENETLLKIDIDITSDEYKEPVKRKKGKSCNIEITGAAGIPGTQEIVPIPPLWSAKVDPQREKDIQIELLDNEKKKSINKQGSTKSITNTTSAPIGLLITNQPGFISKVPEYIQQPNSSLLPIKTKKRINNSIISRKYTCI
ncbi:MAG: hypothetical protein EZS28_008998 [Streblomastix strix]|uniref:Uncharacterized protein n=1 Tax=Streblomastix strix TaxID=222440 RepID=A0A5J4WKP1_9EUKA|nr:MAG: hypothetical protein EZS28_008998 [Streblomastix strix]